MPWEIIDDAPASGNGKWEIVDEGPAPKSTMQNIGQGLANLGAGAIRGAGSIGATILAPADIVKDAFQGRGLSLESNRERRAAMDAALGNLGAETDSLLYKGGKLAGEVAGTAGAGSALAIPVRAAAATRYGAGIEPLLTGAAQALQTGGFRVGDLAGTGAGMAARVAGGALSGGAAAGLVNPEDAGTGALIGGGLPIAAQAAGRIGAGIRRAVTGGGVSPEVAQLAQRAQDLGIQVPADRLANSRPLNALASSLNYVPGSGRAAAEDAMNSQLNTALSKTFGENTPNITKGLRDAGSKLGGEFDRVLRGNTVKMDPQFAQELADSAQMASRELGQDGAGIIARQVEDILGKVQNGQIDGQAAYNIKRTLDRIGQRNTPEAFYANDLKKTLMGALNRSLGPDEAAKFAQTRQQYGAMLDLEKIAKNGAEGEISVARLANMRNINNPQMQELADIAAQFVKPREGAHGSAQRVFGALGSAGLGAGIAGGPLGAALGLGTTMAGGRMANSLLNSQAGRNFVLQQPGLLGPQIGNTTRGLLSVAPVLAAQP